MCTNLDCGDVAVFVMLKGPIFKKEIGYCCSFVAFWSDLLYWFYSELLMM